MEQHKVISGKLVLFDSETLAIAAKYSLCLSQDKSGRHSLQISEGSLKGTHLSRLILEAPDYLIVDHKNGNCLDFRKCNLRLATPTQNQANRKIQCNNTSGAKGVSWSSQMNKWKVYIQRQHLGYFDSLGEATQTYQKVAAMLHGDFALHLSRLQEPPHGETT